MSVIAGVLLQGGPLGSGGRRGIKACYQKEEGGLMVCSTGETCAFFPSGDEKYPIQKGGCLYLGWRGWD